MQLDNLRRDLQQLEVENAWLRDERPYRHETERLTLELGELRQVLHESQEDEDKVAEALHESQEGEAKVAGELERSRTELEELRQQLLEQGAQEGDRRIEQIQEEVARLTEHSRRTEAHNETLASKLELVEVYLGLLRWTVPFSLHSSATSDHTEAFRRSTPNGTNSGTVEHS